MNLQGCPGQPALCHPWWRGVSEGGKTQVWTKRCKITIRTDSTRFGSNRHDSPTNRHDSARFANESKTESFDRHDPLNDFGGSLDLLDRNHRFSQKRKKKKVLTAYRNLLPKTSIHYEFTPHHV